MGEGQTVSVRFKEIQTWEDGNTVCLIGVLNEAPHKQYFLNNKGMEIAITTTSIGVHSRCSPKCVDIGIEACFTCGEALGELKLGQHIKLKGELTHKIWEEDGIEKKKVVVLVLEFKELEIEECEEEIPFSLLWGGLDKQSEYR